jgi:hypothetical protein
MRATARLHRVALLAVAATDKEKKIAKLTAQRDEFVISAAKGYWTSELFMEQVHDVLDVYAALLPDYQVMM